MQKFSSRLLFVATSLIFLSVLSPPVFAQSQTLPAGEREEYFYVFGPDGDALYGKDDSSFELHIDFEEDAIGNWQLEIYDANVGGLIDNLVGPAYGNTEVRYRVIGDKTLDDKTFDAESPDQSWVPFGSYAIQDGKQENGKRRFVFEVKGIRGNDQNLFKVRVTGKGAVISAEDVTICSLSKGQGEVFLYPEIEHDSDQVVVKNLNTEAGALSLILDPKTKKQFTIQHVKSEDWQTMRVNLGVKESRRLHYMIKPTRRSSRNAGVKFETEGGRRLPIYFEPGAPVQSVDLVLPDAQTSELRDEGNREPDEEEGTLKANACNTFTFDARDSYDLSKKKITYKWDFGDGRSSDLPVVTHTYSKPGTYRLTLSVSNHSGLQCETATSSQDIAVSVPPEIRIAAPEASCVNESVLFDASQSAWAGGNLSDLKFNWDFGDGTRGEGIKPEKTYAQGGTYTVRLNGIDKEGTDCSRVSQTKVIHINGAPTAVLNLTPTEDGRGVKFDALGSHDSDGDTLYYKWNFGDGQVKNYAAGIHTYAKPGNYKVTLLVSDQKGTQCSSAQATSTANSAEPPQRQYYDKRYFSKKKAPKQDPRMYYDKQYFRK